MFRLIVCPGARRGRQTQYQLELEDEKFGLVAEVNITAEWVTDASGEMAAVERENMGMSSAALGREEN